MFSTDGIYLSENVTVRNYAVDVYLLSTEDTHVAARLLAKSDCC